MTEDAKQLDAKPIRTVADALREMPVGTAFTLKYYAAGFSWKKIADDVFTDGDLTIAGRHFWYLDRPHDDPRHGIIILSTPDAVPPTREEPKQPAGDDAKPRTQLQDFMEEARQIAAHCWCDDSNSGKVMDPTLAESFAYRIASWMSEAARYSRNEEFYRDIIDLCAAHLGPEAYTDDTGGVHQDPIRLKIPELVARLVDTKQPAGVVVTREWLEETIAALKHASHCFHETMLDGKEVENARNNRDNCARLAADARRKANHD